MRALGFYKLAKMGAASLAFVLLLAGCKGPWSKEFKQEEKRPNVSRPLINPIPPVNMSINGGPKTIPVTLNDPDSNLTCHEAISTHSSDITVVPATYMDVSGTPPNCFVTIRPAPGVTGSSEITLTVTDGENISSTSFMVNAYGLPAANATPVPIGIINLAYAGFDVTGTGGLAPYTYSLASGALPAGITINPTTGRVSGTPTDYGKFADIVFRVTDADGGTATTAPFTLYVASYNISFLTSTTLPAGVNFVRGTAGTRVGATGLIETVDPQFPRYTFSLSDQTNQGLLIEEKRSNLISVSERFEAPYYWAPALATIPAALVAAPDGRVAAQLLQETTANGVHNVTSRAVQKPGPAAGPYTFSVFLKAKGRTNVLLRLASGGNYAEQVCSLTGSGSVGSAASAGFATPRGTITAFPNGWYRCSLSTVSDASATMTAEIRLRNGAVNSYAGDTNAGAYLWGAQLENAANPGSYIPSRNLVTNSEQIDTWALTSLAAPLANSEIAPDGVRTADGLNDNVTNAAGVASRIIPIADTENSYTVSVYVKKLPPGSPVVGVKAETSLTFGTVYWIATGIAFDAANGTYKPLDATYAINPTSVKIENVSASYWRVAFTMDSYPDNDGSLRLSLHPAWANDLGNAATTAAENNARGTAHFWGFQAEPGFALTAAALPTYYRMTSGTERDPDLVNFTLANGPFNASEGTAVSSVGLDLAPDGTVPALCFNDGTASGKITQTYTSSLASLEVVTGGVTQGSPTRVVTAPGKLKMASAYKYNDLALAVNGSLGGTSAAATLPAVNNLYFGRSQEGTSYLNGQLRTFLYFNARVPNSLLPGLSATP